MSASRMPWEIPGDVQSHEWADSASAGSECSRCGASRLSVAFFGGGCIRRPEPGVGES